MSELRSNYRIQGVMQMDDWVQRLFGASTANNNTDYAAKTLKIPTVK